MIKTSGFLLLFWMICAVSPVGAQTYLGVLTSPANNGPGGSCCSSVAKLDADNAAAPTDGSCAGCSVITPDQYHAYLNAVDLPHKTQVTAITKAATGITLTCSTTPSSSGTYAVDNTMMTELLAIDGLAQGNSFPSDFNSISVRDAAGGLHTFPSAKAFTDFYKIVAWYWVQLLDAKQRIISGEAVSFPAATSSAC